MPDPRSGAGTFPATRHSVVLAAGSPDPAARREAFASIVEAYWKPVYKYTRLRWQASAEEAEDLTQAFFARAFEKDFFRTYDASKARFRTFLRVCLDGFIANERKAAHRLKRGGHAHVVPLDFQTAEGELRQHDVAVPSDMDEYFEREWARSLLGLAIERLRAHLHQGGRDRYFLVFQRYDLDGPQADVRPTYGQLARELSISTTDVTNHLAAARRLFRGFVLERLRELTTSDEEYRAEAKRLLGVDV